jgi:hypothetical protein
VTRRRRALAALLALALAPAAGRAQAPDTLAADSVRADTTDFSALFLQSREESRLRVPVPPLLGRPGLLPARTRLAFDRDTLEWHNAQTVGDVLGKVPGLFLWRGGWVGRPEMPAFQGRGAGGVEYLLDGVPLLPLGPDSVAVDPSLLPLSFLDRVEVERLPGLLRIHLFTRRHDRLPPRTRVAVSSGDFDIARYQGMLERRAGSGWGFTVAAEHLAVPLSRDQQGAFRNTQGWLQLSYVPHPGLAARLQVFRSGPDRDGIFDGPGGRDTLSAGLDGRRTDVHATFSWGGKADGLGRRLTALVAWSAWREDSTGLALPLPPTGHQHLRLVDQSVLQAGVLGAYRTRSTSLEAGAWYRSRWTPVEVRAAAAAAPDGRLAGSVEAVYRRHVEGRTSRWVTGRAGVALPFGLEATGLARVGSVVASPAVRADSAVSLADWAALVAFDRPRVALEAGYWRTAGSNPMGFSLYRMVPALGPAEPARWVTVSGRMAPRQWLIIDGWYSDAVGAGPAGQPPTHGAVNATIQSRFLPTFRSGIFALKLQAGMESWGTGVIGRDPAGDPVVLPGATFLRGQIQFQIGTFIAFYDRVNLAASRQGYVPGLPLLRFASTFGVRWEFSN